MQKQLGILIVQGQGRRFRFCMDLVFIKQVHVIQACMFPGILKPLLNSIMKVHCRINDVGRRHGTLHDLSGILLNIFTVLLAHPQARNGTFMISNGFFLFIQALTDDAAQAFRGIHGAVLVPQGGNVIQSDIHFSLIKDADESGNISFCIVAVAVGGFSCGEQTAFFVVAECVSAYPHKICHISDEIFAFIHA